MEVDAAPPHGKGNGASQSAAQATHRSHQFAPDARWTLISQGAEARIWKIPQTGTASPPYDFAVDAIAKERFAKSYRHPALDDRLTKQRCRAEARILVKCAKLNAVPVPAVLRVEPPVLYLEFIHGITVRDRLEELLQNQYDTTEHEALALAIEMGSVVGKLHSLGIVHGDLTTSNMMLRTKNAAGGTEASYGLAADSMTTHVSSDATCIVMIDFGLAKHTESAEERAVDLYVLERALSSTHPGLPDNFLDTVLAAYRMTAKKADTTLQRLVQVQKRGRKRECFG